LKVKDANPLDRESSLDSLEPRFLTNTFKVRIKTLDGTPMFESNMAKLYDNYTTEKLSNNTNSNMVIHENRVYESSNFLDEASFQSKSNDLNSSKNNSNNSRSEVKILNNESLIFIPNNSLATNSSFTKSANTEEEFTTYPGYMKGSKLSASNNTSDFIDMFQDQTNVSTQQHSNASPFVLGSKCPNTERSYFSHLRDAYQSSNDQIDGYDNNSYLKQSFKCKITSPYSSLNNTATLGNPKRPSPGTLDRALDLQRSLSDQKKNELDKCANRNKNPQDILKNLLTKFEDLCSENTTGGSSMNTSTESKPNSFQTSHLEDKFC
jgi:hypothetical protein